jgi:hypothetical protein
MPDAYHVIPVPAHARVGLIATDRIIGCRYEIHGPHGLYGTTDNRADAELVAYGLNNGYPQHATGGYSDFIADRIRADMLKGTTP